jgi:hypothetical protein
MAEDGPPLGSSLNDAPLDGATYGRAMQAWTEALPMTGGVLTGALTAPSLAMSANTTDAPAGAVGEYVEAALPSANALTLVSGANANVITIALTPGDWLVWGSYAFDNAPNNLTIIAGWVNDAAAQPTQPQQGFTKMVSGGQQTDFGDQSNFATGTRRFLLTVPTTIYLGVNATFAAPPASAWGIISAIRLR